MILDAVFQEVDHRLNADFGTAFILGGNSPDLNGCIRLWQYGTEYKDGDLVIAEIGTPYGICHALLECKKDHTSYDEFPTIRDATDFNERWKANKLMSNIAIGDIYGNPIYTTYATKEEVVGTLGTINEVLATLVEGE
ncbi:MAG: hypothetical protein U0M60_01675 [Clostridia bacterium]|nr:hypothetical protein [Clostridia bacterium]